MNNKDIGNRLTPPPSYGKFSTIIFKPHNIFGVNIFPMLA